MIQQFGIGGHYIVRILRGHVQKVLGYKLVQCFFYRTVDGSSECTIKLFIIVIFLGKHFLKE